VPETMEGVMKGVIVVSVLETIVMKGVVVICDRGRR